MDIEKNMCTKKSFDQYFCKFEGKMFEFYFHLRWFLTITKFVDALKLIPTTFTPLINGEGSSYLWSINNAFIFSDQKNFMNPIPFRYNSILKQKDCETSKMLWHAAGNHMLLYPRVLYHVTNNLRNFREQSVNLEWVKHPVVSTRKARRKVC